MIKKTLFFLFFLTSLFQTYIQAENAEKNPSIIPDFGLSFNIKPYIPSNFVLHALREHEEYLWMPEKFFEKYIESSNSRHPPFIQVFIYKGSNYKGAKKRLKEYEKYFSINKIYHWGDYEVVSIKMDPSSDDDYMAYVNLNKDGGSIVMFQLNYSRRFAYGTGNKPSKEDLDFWYDFLHKTTSE